MRELGIALGQMHGQADLGRQDMATGSWARLESIRSIPWSGQNRIKIRTLSPADSGIYTKIKWVWLLKGCPGTCASINLLGMCTALSTKILSMGPGNPVSNHSRRLVPTAPAVQGTWDHANPSPRHRIGVTKCVVGLIP